MKYETYKIIIIKKKLINIAEGPEYCTKNLDKLNIQND